LIGPQAPAAQAAAAVGGFMAFLAEVGASRDAEQQTKTRWALSYYAGKQAGSSARRASGTSKRKKSGAKASESARKGGARRTTANPAKARKGR
jgi:hypothetical protein